MNGSRIPLKYYVFTWWHGMHGGRRWVLACTEEQARRILKRKLRRLYHNRKAKYEITLESIQAYIW